jgi:perosamine synthetase
MTDTKTLNQIEMPAVQTRLNEAEEAALLRVVREGSSYAIGVGGKGGVEGEKFEQAFINMMGCDDAVSVNSCSSALELTALLSGLGPGDEVVLPAHTFVASAVPYARTGATLCWADINPKTWVVSAETLGACITERTKLMVVVHLYGMPADMDAIMALAAKHGVLVVEDCAQAPGARCRGRRVGTHGNFACFSFHSHKNINALGEGGMLVTRDPAHALQARQLRWMGTWPFENERERDWLPFGHDIVEPSTGCWPHNYCMGEANAAVGRQMLQRLDTINADRRRAASRFRNALADFPELVFARAPDDFEHVHYLLPARYDGETYGRHRDDLIELLREKYYLKAVVHSWPLNRNELFSRHGFGMAELPETNRLFDNNIGFPWWTGMSDYLLDDMAARVGDALAEIR